MAAACLYQKRTEMQTEKNRGGETLMKYAENNRISHRQLYRQMILALMSPLLLTLTGRISGRTEFLQQGLQQHCCVFMFFFL